MKEKIKNLFATIVLIVSLLVAWAFILSSLNTNIYDNSGPIFASIPFTILTIYVWNSLKKSK